MEIKKNIENLSVEILDVKLDTSNIPSIKEARLVYINGKAKLVNDVARYGSDHRSPRQIRLMMFHFYRQKFLIAPLAVVYLQLVME